MQELVTTWVLGIGVRSLYELNHLAGSTVVCMFYTLFETEFQIVQASPELQILFPLPPDAGIPGIQLLPGLGDGNSRARVWHCIP